MDKEFIKMTISAKEGKDDRLIKDGDSIDLELIDYLCSVKSSKIDKAFYKYDNKPSKWKPVYLMQVKCPVCGNVRIEKINKTNVIDTIRKIKYKLDYGEDKHYYSAIELLCTECLKEKELLEEKKRKESQKQFAKEVRDVTQKYIEEYLSPDRKFKKEIKPYVKISSIMHRAYLDNALVKRVISNMRYSDFLNTPYWDGVRAYKLKKADYCCELCGGKDTLNVHHKTYKNHGKEHIRSVADSDLIVLCKSCHEKFHDKLDERAVN